MTGHDYLARIADLSPAAAGVHAIAAAIAATSDVGAVSIDTLRERGMTDQFERELLGSGLLRAVGGDLVVVEIEPYTSAIAARESLRARNRQNKRAQREREKAAVSDRSPDSGDVPQTSGKSGRIGQLSPDSGDAGDSGDHPQNAGAVAAAPESTSLTRARMGAPHTPVLPPLLNIVTDTTHTSVNPEREVVARATDDVEREVLDVLSGSFAEGEITLPGVQAGIRAAAYHDVPALAAAYMAAAKGASKSWKLRDAGATLEWAVRKLKTSAPPPAPLDRPGGGAATCPGPTAHAAVRDDLLGRARPLVHRQSEFELWLSDLQVHGVGDRLVLAANRTVAGTVRERFGDLLAEAAGRPVDVVVCSCAARVQDRRSA